MNHKFIILYIFILIFPAAAMGQPNLGAGTVALNNQLLQVAGVGNSQLYPNYTYNTVSFYIVAHQDDWQLFMGYQAWYDMQSYNETAPSPNGAKVIFIYITDGAFCKDSAVYNNGDPIFTNFCTQTHDLRYSQIREDAAMNSVYIAEASSPQKNRPESPYSVTETIGLYGHKIAVNRYKNTVSYFLRINTFCVDQWSGLYAPSLPQNLAAPGYTTDGNVYAGNDDLVNTLAAIYDYECNASGNVVPGAQPWINIQDPNTASYNFCDHNEHTWAGTVAFMADQLYASGLPGSPVLPVNLWEDYVIGGGCAQAMPINLTSGDAMNKSALITAYELTLQQDKSYIEWDSWPHFLNKSYNRLTNTALGWK